MTLHLIIIHFVRTCSYNEGKEKEIFLKFSENAIYQENTERHNIPLRMYQ